MGLSDTQWLIVVVIALGIGVSVQLNRLGRVLDGIHTLLMNLTHPNDEV